MPGGSHPPLQHVPPPIAANGSPPTHAANQSAGWWRQCGGAVDPGGGGGAQRSCTPCRAAASRRYSTCLRPSRRTGHRRHMRHLRWAVAPVAAAPSIREVMAAQRCCTSCPAATSHRCSTCRPPLRRTGRRPRTRFPTAELSDYSNRRRGLTTTTAWAAFERRSSE